MRSCITRNRFTQLATTAALLALAAPAALAQDLNVDVGPTFGTPSAAYGAGAAQPGTWNALTSPAGPYAALNLLNTLGVATTADVANVGGAGDFSFNNGGTVGDDQALMDDLQDVGGVGASTTWTFSQLTNGTYNVYTYAWAPDSAAFIASVSVPGTTSTNPQSCGGGWPGVQTLGITYTRHMVVVAANTLSVTITTTAGFASVNGFQLDLLPPPPPATVPFCFGDGSGTACPCANNSPAVPGGRGCENSNPLHDGCKLTAAGSASVSLNTMSLTSTGMMDGSYCIFLQGTATEGGGLGVISPFYDGLSCVGGTLSRLGRFTTLGSTTTQTGIAGLGMVPPAGGTRHYQTIYRNAIASFCPTATLNTSNGMTINWVP